MSEAATATGVYRATMPACVAGSYRVTVRVKAGADPAVTDVVLANDIPVEWDGSALVTRTAIKTKTDLLADTNYGLAKLVRSTTPANTLNVNASGTADASLAEMLTHALTETSAGYLAAALKKFLDVDVPVFTAKTVNQTGDAYLLGSNATYGFAKLVRSTTAANTLNVNASGTADASLAEILTHAITEGAAGRLAAAITKLLDVATPVLTAASVNQTGDAYLRWTTALTESYAAKGVTATPAQALYMILQQLRDFVIMGTTETVHKLNGTDAAFTNTLNDATAPTGRAAAT